MRLKPSRNLGAWALVLACAVAGCGSSSPQGWTATDKAQYLASCHSLALRGIPGVTHEQRVTYCAAQLKNAEKYNPQHKDVHGFVGAYSAAGGPG
jgi:hypothetical protein